MVSSLPGRHTRASGIKLSRKEIHGVPRIKPGPGVSRGMTIVRSCPRRVGISDAFAQESTNYAKTRSRISKRGPVLYACDRFFRKKRGAPLKHRDARFTVVQPCQTFHIFRAGRSIDLEIEGSLAGGLSFPRVRVAKILVIPGDRRP